MYRYNPRLPSALNFTTPIENLKAYKNCKRMGIDQLREKQRREEEQNDDDIGLYQALKEHQINLGSDQLTMRELNVLKKAGYEEPGNMDKINQATWIR